MLPKILLIVISYNQLDYTRHCVESIQKNTTYPYYLLIIDNCSNAETVEYLQSLQAEKNIDIILNKENQGWIGGVNQGLAYGDYAYYCVMNNDIVVYPRWLSEMVGVAQQDEKIGLVNPQWESPKKYNEDDQRFFEEVIEKHRGEYVETDWMRGFCFLIKKSVVQKIGGLDTVYGAGYYDDWDYSLKAIDAGYRCVRAKGAFVYHTKNVTFTSLMKKFEYDENFNRNKALFYNRWGRPLKILVIYTEELLRKEMKTRKVVEKCLKSQDNIFFLRTVKSPVLEHTNCIERVVSKSFLFLKILGYLLDNVRHSLRKKYDIILCSKKMKRSIEQIPFFTKAYTILALDNESTDQILEKIKKLKQYR